MKLDASGTICAVLSGMMAILIGSPGLVGAQQLQKNPRTAPLVGTEWVLIESDGQHVIQNGWQPHFILKALERYADGSTGQVEGATDSCGNRLTGAYRATTNRLRVEGDNIAGSLRACKLSAGESQVNLGTLLASNLRFQIHGSELDLLESNGAVRVRLVAAHRE